MIELRSKKNIFRFSFLPVKYIKSKTAHTIDIMIGTATNNTIMMNGMNMIKNIILSTNCTVGFCIKLIFPYFLLIYLSIL